MIVDPLTVELDPVRALEILDVVLPVSAHDRTVPPGNVCILDGEIRVLGASTDHKLFLVDLKDLSLKEQK